MVFSRMSVVIFAALSLSACESSMRLPSLGGPFGSSERVSPSAPRIETAPTPQVQSAPLAPPVSAQPLPPPSGSQTSQNPAQSPQNDPFSGGSGGSYGTSGPSTAIDPQPQPKSEPPKVAARPAQPETPSAPTRTSVTGNWNATEASGGSCRVTLSSTPKLDLYNAGTSGCQNKDLQKVTAWELRDDEVYLYEAGGAVAARLKATGGGRFNGALSKTGAPISLSK